MFKPNQSFNLNKPAKRMLALTTYKNPHDRGEMKNIFIQAQLFDQLMPKLSKKQEKETKE